MIQITNIHPEDAVLPVRTGDPCAQGPVTVALRSARMVKWRIDIADLFR